MSTDTSIVAIFDRGRVNENDSANLTTRAYQVVQKRPQTSRGKLDEASVTWCLGKLAILVRDHPLRMIALEVVQSPRAVEHNQNRQDLA